MSNPDVQFVTACSPEMEAPYSSEEEKMRLLDLYRYMHSRIHSTSRPLKLIYHVAERETLLAWVCICVQGCYNVNLLSPVFVCTVLLYAHLFKAYKHIN